MNIKTKKELEFCIAADHMMNRGTFKRTFKQRIKELFFPDYIMEYLRTMRKCNYYRNCKITPPLCFYNKLKLRRLALKLGFSIGDSVFGYGLIIPHYGTIVVGNSNNIGNYAVLHTSICISDNGKSIGDGLYCSTGVKMTSPITLGNNISVGANSLVNKSFTDDNLLIGGMPAKEIKISPAWYIRDGKTFLNRVEKIELYKKKLGITL